MPEGIAKNKTQVKSITTNLKNLKQERKGEQTSEQSTNTTYKHYPETSYFERWKGWPTTD